MFKANLLAQAVRAVVAGGALALAMPALAATTDVAATDMERIEVTGSRIKRTDFETASPMSVYSSADLAKAGYTTVEDFIQNIPAINGGNLGSSVNNASSGLATASLRGLGDGRTLLLINGRRVAKNDLNLIPISYIERIEVLRDGASTIYGSDAIAGVINFITKSEVEGAQFNAQYDLSDEQDGENYLLDTTLGNRSERGNLTLNASFSRRTAILQSERPFSRYPLADDGQSTYFSGSGTAYPGLAIVGDDYLIFDQQQNAFVDFDSSIHGYDFAPDSYLVTPQDVFSLNGAGRQLLAETRFTTLSTFAELGFSNRQSSQQMAPEGTFWGLAVPATNPGNIWGEEVTTYRRLVEAGQRSYEQDAQSWRLVAGLDGELNNGWGWELSYNQQRFTDSQVEYGRANMQRIGILVDPDACAQAGCPGVWNPLASGSLTPAMVDYAFVANSPLITQNLRTVQFNLTGDSGGLRLPAGAIGWAIGYENRYEDYRRQPDSAADQLFLESAEPIDGSTRANEGYAEANLPLLASQPWVERLNLIAAVRYSAYDFIDDGQYNKKFGLEYAPVADLLLRATYADGFRAPSITELYSPVDYGAQSYTDPCLNWGANPNANVRANCAADGLPQDFALASDQAQSLNGGNTELQPEESESITLGFVYNPQLIDGLSLAVDYFDIRIDNAIGTAGTDNIISECYQSANFSSPLCELIRGPQAMGATPSSTAPDRRDGLQNIAGVDLGKNNLASFQTRGVDFDLGYQLGQVGPGELALGVEGTYLRQYDYRAYEGATTIEAAGKIAEDQWYGIPAAFPEWRANLGADYRIAALSLGWMGRYQSAVELYYPDPSYLANRADAVLYHDIQGSYDFGRYQLSAGIRNLLDEEPPYLTEYDDMNTIPVSYDTAGRYFYLRGTASF